MRLTSILSQDRVLVAGGDIRSKDEAIEILATLLARGMGQERELVFKALVDRERMQSTGIGSGVAVPHGSLCSFKHHMAAMLLYPSGIEFQSIDGCPACIIIGVIGPHPTNGELLRMLAYISRLLRNSSFRDRLLGAVDGVAAFHIIKTEEDSGP